MYWYVEVRRPRTHTGISIACRLSMCCLAMMGIGSGNVLLQDLPSPGLLLAPASMMTVLTVMIVTTYWYA